jgi:hypothetical protein
VCGNLNGKRMAHTLVSLCVRPDQLPSKIHLTEPTLRDVVGGVDFRYGCMVHGKKRSFECALFWQKEIECCSPGVSIMQFVITGLLRISIVCTVVKCKWVHRLRLLHKRPDVRARVISSILL